MIARLAFALVLVTAGVHGVHAQGRVLYTTTGLELRISYYAWFSFNECKSLGLPQIANVRASAGGKVWTKGEDLPLTASTSPQGARCIGKAITSAAIYYLPAPGFEGTETIQYSVLYPASCSNCKNADVTVQVKVAGRTAPTPEETETQSVSPR